MLQLVARAASVPKCSAAIRQHGVLVTRYLGATWSEPRRSRPTTSIGWRRCCVVCTRSRPAGVRIVDLASTVHGYSARWTSAAIRSWLTLPALREARDKTAMQLRKGSMPMLCHNDVHHLNIVDDGSLRLIDWEYAGVGEPLFDLASVCVYHRYRRSQRERLLSAYAAPSEAVTWQRLELACWLFDYIRDLWMARRSLSPLRRSGSRK